jgi:hypothetical protein
LVSDEPPADFTKAEDFVLMDHQTTDGLPLYPHTWAAQRVGSDHRD